MTLWGEDFSTWTFEEVLLQQTANRAWGKELRRKNSSLVNSRLANEISQVDYLANRKVSREETLECQRRATMLETQIARAAFHQR